MMEKTGAGKMYNMKPVFSLPDKLPQAKVMYEMKNIHDYCRIVSKIEQQAPHPEIAALETRQKKILGQLAELKQIIASLSVMVKNTDQTETTTIIRKDETKKDLVIQNPITMDLVVKVDRRQIPYSLLALRTIWQDTYFNIACHSHSDKCTLKSTDEIATFEKTVQFNEQRNQNKNGLNVVNLTIIWKNVDILEIRADLSTGCLLGETTLLRLLSRAIQSHNYENNMFSEELSLMDKILDQCYELDVTRSDEVLKSIITQLDKSLKSTNTWIASKNEPTIADIAVWSVIKNHPMEQLPNNVAKWFDRCQKQFCC